MEGYALILDWETHYYEDVISHQIDQYLVVILI